MSLIQKEIIKQLTYTINPYANLNSRKEAHPKLKQLGVNYNIANDCLYFIHEGVTYKINKKYCIKNKTNNYHAWKYDWKYDWKNIKQI